MQSDNYICYVTTNMRYLILSFLLPLALQISFGQSAPPSHNRLDQLLKKYVSADGLVNYKALVKDTLELNKYLAELSANPPHTQTWSRQDQMAYWINAYNAFTLQLVARYYPVKSIKDIGSSIQIPFINTPWDIKFIRIGKEKIDLNHIEHGILRKQFDDPRIHMALVCASKSCPILANEAFTGSRLEEQLNRQSAAFLADPFRNQVHPSQPRLSMIFKWYAMDFNKNGGSVRAFVNAHSPVKIQPKASWGYLEYDWALNER